MDEAHAAERDQVQKQLNLFSPEKGGVYSDFGLPGSMPGGAYRSEDRDGGDRFDKRKKTTSKDLEENIDVEGSATNKGRVGTKTVYDGILEYVSGNRGDGSKDTQGEARYNLPDELPMAPDRKAAGLSPKGLAPGAHLGPSGKLLPPVGAPPPPIGAQPFELGNMFG